MKFRNLGLGTGLTLGGGLMAGGLFVMSFEMSASGGGGIMIVLGMLFFLPGLFIAAVTLFGWLIAKTHSALNGPAKHWFSGIVIVLLIGTIVLPIVRSIYASWQIRPQLTAELEGDPIETVAYDEQAATLQLQVARDLLVGAWRSQGEKGVVIVLDDLDRMYRSEDAAVKQYGVWSLWINPYDPPPTIRLFIKTDIGTFEYAVTQVDDLHLVAELSRDGTNTLDSSSTDVITYERVADIEGLPAFDFDLAPPLSF